MAKTVEIMPILRYRQGKEKTQQGCVFVRNVLEKYTLKWGSLLHPKVRKTF